MKYFLIFLIFFLSACNAIVADSEKYFKCESPDIIDKAVLKSSPAVTIFNCAVDAINSINDKDTKTVFKPAPKKEQIKK